MFSKKGSEDLSVQFDGILVMLIAQPCSTCPVRIYLTFASYLGRCSIWAKQSGSGTQTIRKQQHSRLLAVSLYVI